MIEKNNQNIAIFDLDHTITCKDTYLDFLLRYLKKNPSRLIQCWFLPLAVIVQKLKFQDNTWLKEVFLTAIVGGTGKVEMEDYCADFVQHTLDNNISKDALNQLKIHKQKGDYLVLATASFDFYVEKISDQLGFDKFLCTVSDWGKGDSLSGKISGVNCYGQNKKRIIENFLKERKADKGTVYIYSDHHSDIPVLELADKAFAVNPTSKLLSMSLSRDIQVVRWQ